MIPYLLIGIPFLALLIWKVVSVYYSSQWNKQREALEIDLKKSNDQVHALEAALSQSKQQTEILNRQLGEERHAHELALHSMTRKGFIYLFAGLIIGGTISGFAVKGYENQRFEIARNSESRESIENQILLRIKSEQLQKSLKRIHGKEKELMDEKEKRAVAETKLEILLNSLSPKRFSDGYLIDYEKLQRQLHQNVLNPISENKSIQIERIGRQ